MRNRSGKIAAGKEPERSLRILRNRTVAIEKFRMATGDVSLHLMRKLQKLFQKRGVKMKDIVLVFILRAAVGMLPAAFKIFPSAPTGILGLGRNEGTKRPFWYLEKLPPLSPKSVVVIFDPMLATGGSACAAVSRITQRGARPAHIYYVGVIGAPEGLTRLAKHIPEDQILLATLDERLDANAMIVPGLGDFGDRFFGNLPAHKKRPQLQEG